MQFVLYVTNVHICVTNNILLMHLHDYTCITVQTHMPKDGYKDTKIPRELSMDSLGYSYSFVSWVIMIKGIHIILCLGLTD